MPSVKRPAEDDGRGEEEKKHNNRQNKNGESILLLPTYIIKPLLHPSSPMRTQPSSPPTDSGPATPLFSTDNVCQVVKSVAASKSAIYEVAIGKMEKRVNSKKLDFVRDEGKPTVACKIQYCQDNRPDPLDPEFSSNASIMSYKPNAYDLVVPAFCHSKAGYQTLREASDGEDCVTMGTVAILLQPLHLTFRSILDDPLYSEQQRRELFKSGYDQLRLLHDGPVGFCHRDVKTDNAVVQAERNDEGELVPVRPMKLLFVDCADARKIGTDKRFGEISGTSRWSSISVVQSWYLDWWIKKAVDNKRINVPAPEPIPVLPENATRAQKLQHRYAVQKAKMMDLKTPHWKPGEYEKMLTILENGIPDTFEADNDLWGWGMSLIQYLDIAYFHSTSFPDSKFETFCTTFPADGGPNTDYARAKKEFASIRKFFVPLYDHHTWKKQVDENGVQVSLGNVEEQWWPLLTLMLGRPAVDTHWATEIDFETPFKMDTAFDKAINYTHALNQSTSSGSTTAGIAQQVAALGFGGDVGDEAAEDAGGEAVEGAEVAEFAKEVPESGSLADMMGSALAGSSSAPDGNLDEEVKPKKKAFFQKIKKEIVHHHPHHGTFLGGTLTYNISLPDSHIDPVTKQKHKHREKFVCALPGCGSSGCGPVTLGKRV